MQVGVITLFPEMFAALTDYGVIGRAFRERQVELHCVNPRTFTSDRHQTVDDRPYGGGPGMVMRPEPLTAAVLHAKQLLPKAKVMYLSPQGKTLTQPAVKMLAAREQMILVAGRYEGVDERFIESCVDEEWSIGDYVLSGGEFPAMVLVDAVVRQLPGVLGDDSSAQQDSFSDGLVDCPHYTRPEQHELGAVPAVLMSGDHAAIRRWRLKQALGRTWLRRPDLLQEISLDEESKKLLLEFQEEHRTTL